MKKILLILFIAFQFAPAQELISGDSYALDADTFVGFDSYRSIYSIKNNVLQKHIDKNMFIKFEKTHFSIWLDYLLSTVDENFTGLKSDLLKNRAQSIATVMQLKMNLYK